MIKKSILGNKAVAPVSPKNYTFDKIKNKNSDSNFLIRLTVPEFTSICPVTNQPDFALIVIDYTPDSWIVESKSFKLYIHSFRNYGIFHEEVTLLIGKSLHEQLKLKWLRISSFFAPRGGIPIDTYWQSSNPPKGLFLPDIIKRNSSNGLI